MKIEKLQGFTIAIITSVVQGQHMWSSQGPKCSKIVKVLFSCNELNLVMYPVLLLDFADKCRVQKFQVNPKRLFSDINFRYWYSCLLKDQLSHNF